MVASPPYNAPFYGSGVVYGSGLGPSLDCALSPQPPNTEIAIEGCDAPIYGIGPFTLPAAR